MILCVSLTLNLSFLASESCLVHRGEKNVDFVLRRMTQQSWRALVRLFDSRRPIIFFWRAGKFGVASAALFFWWCSFYGQVAEFFVDTNAKVWWIEQPKGKQHMFKKFEKIEKFKFNIRKKLLFGNKDCFTLGVKVTN